MKDVLDAGIIEEMEIKTVGRWNTFLCSFNWHKWTFWKAYETPSHLPGVTMFMQKHNCVICGKTETTSAFKV
jgi:hypothetical protein